jgi:hypothetical protein
MGQRLAPLKAPLVYEQRSRTLGQSSYYSLLPIRGAAIHIGLPSWSPTSALRGRTAEQMFLLMACTQRGNAPIQVVMTVIRLIEFRGCEA